MSYEVIAYIADNNDKSRIILESIISQYHIKSLESFDDYSKIDVILVLGGDGFMLKSLHEYMLLKKPFFGINTGNAGFLLNVQNSVSLLKRLENAKVTKIFPLMMQANLSDGTTKTAIAFNEVSLVRSSPQAAKIRIYVNDSLQISELIADGVLLATPAGSSAYNFSVGGAIVPIESSILSLTPIGVFRPKRWSGALLPRNTRIKCEVIESDKRPVIAVTDFNNHGDVASVEMSICEDFVQLLFDPGHSLEERIIREQFLY